jgi:putative ABC transport system permease protein
MENVVDRAIAGARFNATLLGVFAEIAFLLAAVGIYGVISCDVSERIHEIGIRVALGAQPGDVLKLVLGHGARLAAYGIAAGMVAAFALTRLMASMLYGVQATDAYTFVAIPVLLGAVALAASYLPSRRALALDPMTALRHE